MTVSRMETSLRQLEPVFLLVDLYNSHEHSLRNHCGPIRGRYRRRGEDIADAQCANCDRPIVDERFPNWAWVPAVEGHPKTDLLRERLCRSGIRSYFSNYQDPGMDARVFNVETSPATLCIVRNMAKQDLGIESASVSIEFDRRFNLYFNQKYAFDWKDWQAKFPEEFWPAPADGWENLRDEFQLLQSRC